MNKEPVPIDFWHRPLECARNNFKNKSLSSWACNPAIGCQHACRFCYVPEVSTNRMAGTLFMHGVEDTDEQWGEYLFLRKFDRPHWQRTLRIAEQMPPSALNPDGHRAVMYSTTTDPFQVIRHPDPVKRKELQEHLLTMIQTSLEDILMRTTLRVRILTRSPLAAVLFPLMKEFGDRLLFGMSLPTLDDKLLKLYEPQAPGAQSRLNCLKRAKVEGLNVFVAVAPVYPECTDKDAWRTLCTVKELDPVTVFMEPINIRAENIDRIQKRAAELEIELWPGVFDSKASWAQYATRALLNFEDIAAGFDLTDRLHLWPDAALHGYAPPSLLRRYWGKLSNWPGVNFPKS